MGNLYLCGAGDTERCYVREPINVTHRTAETISEFDFSDILGYENLTNDNFMVYPNNVDSNTNGGCQKSVQIGCTKYSTYGNGQYIMYIYLSDIEYNSSTGILRATYNSDGYGIDGHSDLLSGGPMIFRACAVCRIK